MENLRQLDTTEKVSDGTTIKAVLFDFDDTLIHSSESLFTLIKKAVPLYNKARGKNLVFFETKKSHALYSLHFHAWLEESIKGVDVQDFLDFYVPLIDKLVGHYPPVVGAQELIDALKKKGKVVAILSGRDNTLMEKRLVEAGFSKEDFAFIFTRSETPATKPNPHVFSIALEEFAKEGIKREEVVYVGDAFTDYLAAKRAGMGFIGVKTGTHFNRALLFGRRKKFFLVDKLMDILGVVEKM